VLKDLFHEVHVRLKVNDDDLRRRSSDATNECGNGMYFPIARGYGRRIDAAPRSRSSPSARPTLPRQRRRPLPPSTLNIGTPVPLATYKTNLTLLF
jgi:hypothetical protein